MITIPSIGTTGLDHHHLRASRENDAILEVTNLSKGLALGSSEAAWSSASRITNKGTIRDPVVIAESALTPKVQQRTNSYESIRHRVQFKPLQGA
jgi:hypothetical protein